MRQYWHVYGVMRDNSVDAFTPTLGFASNIVSITVVIFFTFIAIVFWLSGLTDKKKYTGDVADGSPQDVDLQGQESRA